MRQPALKPVQLFAVVLALFFIAHACNKSPVPTTEQTVTTRANSTAKFSPITDITAGNYFNKSVGKPIDGRLGDRWIANYKKKNGYNQSYTLNNTVLQAIVSQTNCVGIALYYAKDANNKTHILPVGVDIKGKRMQTLTVNCTQGNISWATALQWIAKDAGAVDAHFFGSYTFERLNQTPCKTIRVDFAIDDKNMPQLLLTNTCQVSLVKQYEDESNRCPPYCP